MTNIDKLKELGMLHIIRLRMGAENGIDESVDEVINKMYPDEIMEEYSYWHLGSKSWWREMIERYDFLKYE